MLLTCFKEQNAMILNQPLRYREKQRPLLFQVCIMTNYFCLSFFLTDLYRLGKSLSSKIWPQEIDKGSTARCDWWSITSRNNPGCRWVNFWFCISLLRNSLSLTSTYTRGGKSIKLPGIIQIIFLQRLC